MSRLSAGDLDRRLHYQEPSDGDPDALGQVQDGWATVATVWAEVRTPTGRELFNAGQTVATVDHVVTIRRARGWFPSATGRFVLSSPVYDATPHLLNLVSAADPDNAREWVVCMCLEQTEPESEST